MVAAGDGEASARLVSAGSLLRAVDQKESSTVLTLIVGVVL